MTDGALDLDPDPLMDLDPDNTPTRGKDPLRRSGRRRLSVGVCSAGGSGNVRRLWGTQVCIIMLMMLQSRIEDRGQRRVPRRQPKSLLPCGHCLDRGLRLPFRRRPLPRPMVRSDCLRLSPTALLRHENSLTVGVKILKKLIALLNSYVDQTYNKKIKDQLP